MEETLKLILNKLDSLDSKVSSLERNVLKIEIEHGSKLDALMDGYKLLYENQQEMRKDIKDIKATLEIHEVKLLKVK